MNIRVTEIQDGNDIRYPLDFIADHRSEQRYIKANGTKSQIESYEIWFEDMHLLLLELNPIQQATIKIETDFSSCILFFTLCGEILSDFPDGSNAFSFVKGEHNLIYSPPFKLLLDLRQSSKIFMIHLSEKFIKRLVNEDFPLLADMDRDMNNKEAVTLGCNLKITSSMNILIESILHCEHTGYMKRIFLESKILELLFQQMEQYDQHSQNNKHTFLKDYDIEKIYYAKSLVEQNLQNPCSLIELAHKSGLNDFKLKKGFKELLGTTVFGYLHDLRMEKAKQMLEEMKKTINEVAYDIGYKNPHHFSAAFKKKFGVLPSQINK